ncbi:Fur family transcriptional regulator [Kangiella geojedonensis]|uniref:Zinc uptake regulation protein ZUR n=1 Tax=Kangiella geojedonensis TaxID=914150 RepID=A0A0F6RCG7_9GAMM|nr:transcriptional repressor [Kangiella geojedonensis]AKE52036.1 Zinc uptake regulation protein ZUR [Kangiella geojedonensis]
MRNLNEVIGHADQFCKQQGGRLTEKRKEILSQLIKSNKALSAYELIDAYKQESGSDIPPMSVYRILDFLEEAQLVHKLKLANKYVACSHICSDHKHEVPQFLICGNCSRVEEISVSHTTISDIKKSVKNADFSLVSPQLEINCICNRCIPDKDLMQD